MSCAFLLASEVNLAKIKSMIFNCTKRKLNQEEFILYKDPIKIIHEYKYLGIDFIHMNILNHPIKGEETQV